MGVGRGHTKCHKVKWHWVSRFSIRKWMWEFLVFWGQLLHVWHFTHTTHKQFWDTRSASQNSVQLNPTQCWHCLPVNSITSYKTSVLLDCLSSFICLFHVQVVTYTPDLLVTHCSVQFSPVAQLCLSLWDPMDCSTPGLPVHHQFQEFTQTHVHWVSDAIQPSHPLWSPSPPTFNLSQHQGLFQWASSSHQVAKVLEFQLQHQSF